MQNKNKRKKPLQDKAIIASINSDEVKVIARDNFSSSAFSLIGTEAEKDGDISLTFNKKSIESLYSERKISKKLKDALTSIFDDHNALFQATEEERKK
jgi:hypothetical protein